MPVIGIHNGKIADSSILADDQNDDNYDGEENSQEYNLIYVCGRKKSQAHCKCENHVLNCEKQLIGRKKLDHAYIKIMKHPFTVKTAIFKRNNIQILKKGYILPNDCETIEELNFDDNRISEIESLAFDDFDSLKKLNLENNILTSIDETILTKKLGTTLEFLDLGRNKLESFSFKYLHQLIELHLNGNSLKIIKIFMFPKSLAKLKYLHLNGCEIEEIEDDAFENLINLKDLSLVLSRLTSIPRALNGIKNLEMLDLSCSNIVEIKTNEISEDHMLQKLFLFSMDNLTTVGDCAFCGLPNLRRIFFWTCKKLSSIHENAFGALTEKSIPPIEKFFLVTTNISTLSEKLMNWNEVKDLEFTDNPFICDCSMAWLINDFSLHKFERIPKCAGPPAFAKMTFTNISGTVCLDEKPKYFASNKNQLWPYILIVLIFVIVVVLLIYSPRVPLKRIFRRSELPPMIYSNLETQEHQRHDNDHDDSELQRDF